MITSKIGKGILIFIGIIIGIAGTVIFLNVIQRPFESPSEPANPISTQKLEVLAKEKNGKYSIVLEENGVEKFVIEENIDDTMKEFLVDEGRLQEFVQFSPLDGYVLYRRCCQSVDVTSIYDIHKSKLIGSWRTSDPGFKFTPYEKYLIACGHSEMDSVAYGNIYQLSNFQLKYSLTADSKINPDWQIFQEGSEPYMAMGDFNCEYDDAKDGVKFSIKGMYDKNKDWDGDMKKEVEYFLPTGEIQYLE